MRSPRAGVDVEDRQSERETYYGSEKGCVGHHPDTARPRGAFAGASWPRIRWILCRTGGPTRLDVRERRDRSKCVGTSSRREVGCRSALLVNGRLAEHGSGPAEAVATRLTRMLSEPIATLGSEWHDCRPHLSRKRTPAPRPREPHAGERWALGGSVGKQRQLRSDQTTYGSASSDPCAPAAAIPEP